MEKNKNIKLNNRAVGFGVFIIIQPDLVKRRAESLALIIAPPKRWSNHKSKQSQHVQSFCNVCS